MDLDNYKTEVESSWFVINWGLAFGEFYQSDNEGIGKIELNEYLDGNCIKLEFDNSKKAKTNNVYIEVELSDKELKEIKEFCERRLEE